MGWSVEEGERTKSGILIFWVSAGTFTEMRNPGEKMHAEAFGKQEWMWEVQTVSC